MMPPRIISGLLPIAIFLSLVAACLQAQEEPADLIQARSTYKRDVEFATRPIRDRYLSRLELIKKALANKGEIREALAVQEEIEKIRGTGMVWERFAGVWNVRFSDGAVRMYSITAEGAFTFTEENGKRLDPPLSGQLMNRGADVTVEHEPNKIERLSISGGKLIVEHFLPKTTYPSGVPANRGTGIRKNVTKP